jgi:hypothetical protein
MHYTNGPAIYLTSAGNYFLFTASGCHRYHSIGIYITFWAVAADGNHDAKRAALDLDLRRPVKPRWPEFDRDLGGKPAGMPV